MARLIDIRLQKLFALVLGLKVTASGLAWALQRPWSLGFVLPVALMLAYIALGLHRRDDDVPDEKFADSCYYLGFIFTITSIIFALFDLPQIDTRIGSIAVRFGAAMTTTVLGLGVRVYLVSFERDSRDALREAEDAVIDAARRLREQLGLVIDRLHDFESQVDLASRHAVERVDLQLEALARGHAEQLADHFEALARRHEAALEQSLAGLGDAGARLAASFDGYAGNVQSQLQGVDAMVAGFLEAVHKRLEASVFPPDYFSKYLAAPLAQLRSSSQDVARHVREAAGSVGEASGALVTAARALKVRANSVEGGFDALIRLVQQQETTLQGAQRHVQVVAQLAASLQGLDVVLDRAAAGMEASGQAAATLVRRTADRRDDGTRELEQIGVKLDAVVAQLQALHRELAAGNGAAAHPPRLEAGPAPGARS